MLPDRRALTSAANGRRSRGPVTAAGKRRSARNATRHGLASRCRPAEDDLPYRQALDLYLARLRPANSVERALVEEIAVAAGRLRQCWAAETEILNQAAAASSAADPLGRLAAAFVSSAAELALVHRYEARLRNTFQRALRAFQRLRSRALRVLPNEPTFHSPSPTINSNYSDRAVDAPTLSSASTRYSGHRPRTPAST